MTAKALAEFAATKDNFATVEDFITFYRRFVEFVAANGMHGTIISRNENHYHFYQYKADGDHKISRPVNSRLMYLGNDEALVVKRFGEIMAHAKDIPADDVENRTIIRNSIYSIQQAIGIALDAYAVSNRARKVAGDLFERLIRLLISGLGVDCTSGTIGIPVKADNVDEFRMGYQHDLVVRRDEHLKLLGSVKTSSKDRFDKVFMDKFLYSKLTETSLPHVAIFLNDVQRKGKLPKYGINATFLANHFKCYTVKLNPLDGVYYCDLRPNMNDDPFLNTQIHAIDRFFCNDLWEFLAKPHPDVEADEPLLDDVVAPEEEAHS
ncbi:MAG TPA: hypothetical protein VFC78_00375 [Tepidisphaeraceae bacterium]|nr:hypothetical protein [Tepidisphaeraceae bacterium]